MIKTKKNIAILSLIISVFALFGAAAFMLNAKRAFAETSCTLSFDGSAAGYDMAGSTESWNRYNVPVTNDEGGVTLSLNSGDATPKNYAAGIGKYNVEAGKTYVVKWNIRLSANVYINLAIEVPEWKALLGTWAESKSWISNDYTEWSVEYTAGASGTANLIFQLTAGAGDIYVKDFTFTEKIADKTVAEGKAIGELPSIPAKEGYRGYWAVDGAEITADTVYNFGANKVATIAYEEEATSYTLSFKEEHSLTDSAENWCTNIGTGSAEGITYADGIVSIELETNTKTQSAYYTNLGLTAGEKYTVSLDYLGTKGGVGFHLYVGQVKVKTWLWAVNTDWTSFSQEFTADANDYVILKYAGTTSSLQVKNFKIYRTLDERTLTDNAAIGALPSIPAKEGYRGYWAVDGTEITANTVYNFGENKVATIAYEKEKTAIKDTSISLNGDIALNFYASVVDENVKAFFTVDGRTFEATSYTLSNGNERVYSYPLAAKDYEKVVTLTLGEGEDAVSANASVKAYIDAGKNRFDDNLKALVEALEVYCDSAAKYFAGETVGTIQPDGDELANYAPKKEGTLPEGVTLSGITLILESTTTIRIYVDGENIDNVTYTVNGATVTLQTLADGSRYIEMANIAAKDLDKAYEFQIGGCVVSVSALGYAHLVVNNGASDDENLKNLLIATYNYSIAANAYFGADTVSVSTDMGKSIVYASKSENGVQGKYVDNEKTAYTVSNDRVSLTHNLTNRGNLFVSSLASASGAYLTNTMDVYMNSNVNGTETETYACNSTDIQRDGFSTTACAPYVNVNKLGYYYYQVNVRNLNFGNNLFLDKTYHVYSDKLYQEYRIVNYGDTAASLNFIAFQAVMPVSAVTKFEISDGANVVSSLEEGDGKYQVVSNPQYAAFDIAGVGVVGFINSTAENCDFVIIRSGNNYYFRQRFFVTTVEAKGTAGFGSRVYTDSTHAFDGIRAANAEENNPLTAAEITVSGDGASFVGYDRLRGYYVCRIDGCYFQTASANPNKKYIEKITVNAPDERKVFFYINSDYPLEGAAITDENDMLMPIGTQVSKNFAHEHEEPVYDPDDKMYGDTIFPIVTTRDKPLAFSVVNVYENWGNYLAKQISSISYYVAYYHLSSGVRETNCIAPYYATYLNKDETGSWILPDFRGASCDEQYNSSGTNDPLQRNTVGAMNGVSNGTALTAEGADLGVYQGSEIISAGITYADLKYSYISKNGDYKYSYRHVEMPQTDESRTYYTIEMEFLKATTFNQSSFSFFSFDTRVAGYTYANAAYLDESGNPQEAFIGRLNPEWYQSDNWSDGVYKLHKGGSYFAFYNGTAGNEEFGNFGLIVQSSSWTHDGITEELPLAFYNGRIQRGGKYVNRGSLTVGEDWAFPAGATVTLNVILLPFGAREGQTNYDNVKKVYQDSVVNKIQVEASRGIVLEDAFVPTVRALGDVAQFTLSGGATEINENGVIYAVKVTGFNKLGKLKVEKLNAAGEWETVELASESGFDGYGVKYENGTAEYSFVTTKTTADVTYRVSVI